MDDKQLEKIFEIGHGYRDRYRTEGWPLGMTPGDFAAKVIEEGGLDKNDLATQRAALHEALHVFHELTSETKDLINNTDGFGEGDIHVNPEVAEVGGPKVDDGSEGGTS